MKFASRLVVAASRQPDHAAASRCRMIRQNSRAREAHVAISGDRRHSSSRYDRASSGCFSNSHATCRGDDRRGVEAEGCCPARHLCEPQCFPIQSRTMRIGRRTLVDATRARVGRHCDSLVANAAPDTLDADRPWLTDCSACAPESCEHRSYGERFAGRVRSCVRFPHHKYNIVLTRFLGTLR